MINELQNVERDILRIVYMGKPPAPKLNGAGTVPMLNSAIIGRRGQKDHYIFSSGELKRRDNTIYFQSEDEQKHYILIADTSDIVVFGEVDINKRFLEFLSSRKLCCTILAIMVPRGHFTPESILIQVI